jgi:hypothetical protein
MHSRNCEPPSELCCEDCTEADHPRHPPGVPCILDQRVVYGATCTWWASIGDTERTPSGLPCCPHCGGVLFQMDTPAEWWAKVDAYERDHPHPGYRAFVEWLRGRCFRKLAVALAAYEAERRLAELRAEADAIEGRQDD